MLQNTDVKSVSTPLYIGLGDGMILVLVAVVDIFAVVVVANGRGGV